MKRNNIGILIVALLIPLVVGGLSAVCSAQGMAAYGTMNKPPLSPPAWVFSVAWTILYVIMGLASYYIFAAETYAGEKTMPLSLYGIQLLMNFMWSIVFFVWKMYLLAFFWLMVMWIIVIYCALRFYKISKTAGCLMIPYIAWLTFAAYLNIGSYLLNMK